MDMVSNLIQQQVDFFIKNQSIQDVEWRLDKDNSASYDLSCVDLTSIFLQKKKSLSKQDLAPLLNDSNFLLRRIQSALQEESIDFSYTDFETFLFKCDFFDILYQEKIDISRDEAHALINLSIDFFGLDSIPFYASPLKYQKKSQMIRLEKGTIEFVVHSTTQDDQGNYLCYVSSIVYEGGGCFCDSQRKIFFDSPGGDIVDIISSTIEGCWRVYNEEEGEDQEEDWNDQDSWFLSLAIKLLTGVCVWDSYDDSLIYLTDTARNSALKEYKFETKKAKTLHGDFDDQYGQACL